MYNIWKTGKKKVISYENILEILKDVSDDKNHKIIVGSDSLKTSGYFIFVKSICIINKSNKHDKRFFYLRKKIYDEKYYDLYKRLIKETEISLEIALDIRNKIEEANVEIHADVNLDPKHASGKFKNTIIGYIKGCGFNYALKPDSFVASSIADTHTRKS